MWAIRSAGLPTQPKMRSCYDLIIILIEHIRWIEDILSPALVGVSSSMSVVVKLYLTKSEESSEIWGNEKFDTNSGEKSDSAHAHPIAKVLDSPFVSFENGRPDLQNIIQNEIMNASGRMSINGMPTL